jgi:hypothetical protein
MNESGHACSAGGKKVPAEEPYVVAAMLSLLGACVWLLVRGDRLLGFFYGAELLAITHLVALGFATSIVLGVMLRLAPRSLGVEPRSRKLALVQCVTYLVGVAGMVFHFANGSWLGIATAAPLVAAAVAMQLVNFAPVFAKAREPGNWAARWIAAAHVHLALAALLGTTFGVVKACGWDGRVFTFSLVDRLAAHAHLAALGWVSGCIFGFQWKLLPATRASDRLERWRFGATQAGLLGFTIVLLFDLPGRGLFASLIAAAIAARSVPALLGARRNRAGLWEGVAHGLLLMLAAVGLLLVFGVPGAESELRPRLELAYGFVALFGWITLTVAGTAWKLFSLWVWEERFLPEKGRKPIPPVAALWSGALRDGAGIGLLVGSLGTAACVVFAQTRLVRLFLAALLVGALLFVVQFVRIARWELLKLEYRGPTRPLAPPLAPGSTCSCKESRP